MVRWVYMGIWPREGHLPICKVVLQSMSIGKKIEKFARQKLRRSPPSMPSSWQFDLPSSVASETPDHLCGFPVQMQKPQLKIIVFALWTCKSRDVFTVNSHSWVRSSLDLDGWTLIVGNFFFTSKKYVFAHEKHQK